MLTSNFSLAKNTQFSNFSHRENVSMNRVSKMTLQVNSRSANRFLVLVELANYFSYVFLMLALREVASLPEIADEAGMARRSFDRNVRLAITLAGLQAIISIDSTTIDPKESHVRSEQKTDLVERRVCKAHANTQVGMSPSKS